MKYVLIQVEGAAGEASPELDGRTPLDVARTPNCDWISMNGRQGTVVTIPEGLDSRAEWAALSLLGYDPAKHPVGLAALEAVAAGLELAPTDLVFRCNLVTVVDGRLVDLAAGRIGNTEAHEIIRLLNERIAPEGMRFQAGASYRHLLTVAGGLDLKVDCTPPQTILNEPVAGHLPRGRDAGRFRTVMEEASSVLADLEINDVRRDLGENPATGIWPWGAGTRVALPPFSDRFEIKRGAAIAAAKMIRGLAISVGFETVPVAEVADDASIDKGNATVAALDEYDFVLVHVEAPDETGHLGHAIEKVKVIERIDEQVVGPILTRLRSFDHWKVMVVPEYPASAADRSHSATTPPFCLAGDGVHAVLARPFCEAHATTSDLHCDPGHELMEYFLKR